MMIILVATLMVNGPHFSGASVIYPSGKPAVRAGQVVGLNEVKSAIKTIKPLLLAHLNSNFTDVRSDDSRSVDEDSLLADFITNFGPAQVASGWAKQLSPVDSENKYILSGLNVRGHAYHWTLGHLTIELQLNRITSWFGPKSGLWDRSDHFADECEIYPVEGYTFVDTCYDALAGLSTGYHHVWKLTSPICPGLCDVDEITWNAGKCCLSSDASWSDYDVPKAVGTHLNDQASFVRYWKRHSVYWGLIPDHNWQIEEEKPVKVLDKEIGAFVDKTVSSKQDASTDLTEMKAVLQKVNPLRFVITLDPSLALNSSSIGPVDIGTTAP